MAGAGLDEHHVLFHDLAVGAFELHWQRGGSVRRAAAAVGTHPAELSPIGLHTGAARKLEFDRLGDFRRPDALFALLRKPRRETANYYQREWPSSSLCRLALLTCVYILRGKRLGVSFASFPKIAMASFGVS